MIDILSRVLATLGYLLLAALAAYEAILAVWLLISGIMMIVNPAAFRHHLVTTLKMMAAPTLAVVAPGVLAVWFATRVDNTPTTSNTKQVDDLRADLRRADNLSEWYRSMIYHYAEASHMTPANRQKLHDAWRLSDRTASVVSCCTCKRTYRRPTRSHFFSDRVAILEDCGHVVCVNCLSEHVQTTMIRDRKLGFACPQCQQSSTSSDVSRLMCCSPNTFY